MTAAWRFGIAALTAAAIFGSAPALAQDNSAPTTNTATPPPPAAETVGPRELRDFSIPGTVTRPAPTPSERAPARPAQSAGPRPTPAAPSPRSASPAPVRDQPVGSPIRDVAPAARTVATALPEPAPLANPAAGAAVAPESPFAAQPGLQTAQPTLPMATAPQPTDYVPWLIGLLLLGAGAGFFFWRQRAQPSYASATAAPLTAAEPTPRPQPLQRAPAPRPNPAPQPVPAPQPTAQAVPQPAPTPARPISPSGLVTTSLRPWLEIEFSPGRCVVEDDKATIQFDVTVFNSGGAPARDVLVEASMFNAGPAQDQEIGAFFANPVAKGDRIPAIPPLRRITLKSNVSLSREQLRQFDVGGRKLFVPLVGLNALYRWSGGEGQTSASYVVGRDTDNDKMAPLRLDLGPRIFRGLGARQHNVAVRN